jgi:hypothetical protein
MVGTPVSDVVVAPGSSSLRLHLATITYQAAPSLQDSRPLQHNSAATII